MSTLVVTMYILLYMTLCKFKFLYTNSFFFLYRYGFSPAINAYSAFGFSCTGSESSLSQCSEPGAVCTTDNANFAIAIECGGQTSPSESFSRQNNYIAHA